MDMPGAYPSTSTADCQQTAGSGDPGPDDTHSQVADAVQTDHKTSKSPPDPEDSPLNDRNKKRPEDVDVHCRCFKSPDDSGRNLVVCIDGTANQFGINNTNVVELYSRLDKSKKQLTYYDSGIGTFVKDSNWIGRTMQSIANWWDMAVAWNLKRIILSAYRWLSDNYEPGDSIFLFGFSRGAYQVRVISGMITKVGLLPRGNINQIEFAYELYLAGVELNPSWFSWLFHTEADRKAIMEKIEELTKNFKGKLSHKNVTVHFIGLWDTVSSVGITRGASLPETVNGMSDPCGTRHAVSLDERRGKFQPEYLNGGSGPKGYFDPPSNRTKEVWFVGSHSDIGGGNSENVKLDHFGPSLRWMLYEALQYGLKVDLSVGGWSEPQHTPSMRLIWRILDFVPFRRLTYEGAQTTVQWPPHQSRGRLMQRHQLIHESVVKYMGDHLDYTPAAHGLQDCNGRIVEWNQVRDSQDADYIEFDADTSTVGMLTWLRNAALDKDGITDKELKPFLVLTSALRGSSRSIVDSADRGSSELLFEALKHTVESARIDADFVARRSTVVGHIAQALALFSSTPANVPKYLKSTLRFWLADADSAHREQIMNVFGKESTHNPILGHSAAVNSVACVPNGRLLASGSSDRTIRLWEAETGHPVGDPLRGHARPIYSVALSPDEKLIVSGSGDHTVRIWDVSNQHDVNALLIEHVGSTVYSVAFSPDGKYVVSGSADGIGRIWEVAARRAMGEPLRGHTVAVQSVAFSPNGKLVISGSSDKTVRIWDFATRKAVGVLEGHSDAIFDTMFTPDGKRIISVSSDIRVWDVASHQMVLGPLCSSSDTVNAVTITHDGKYFASGSHDKIQLWNAETGEAVGEPLRSQTRPVLSLIFAPDGRQVVSGTGSNALEIWSTIHSVQSTMKFLKLLRDAVRIDGGTTEAALEPLSRLITAVTRGSQSIMDAIDNSSLPFVFEILSLIAESPQNDTLTPVQNQMVFSIAEMLALIQFIPKTEPRYLKESLRRWLVDVDPVSREQIVEIFGKDFRDPIYGHTDTVWSVAYSLNGKFIASGSGDHTARLWDAQTGHPIGEPLRGHTGDVRSVAFSPDGTRLASASRDKTIWIWDVATQRAAGSPLTGHEKYVLSVAFTPDDKHIVSGSVDETVRIWDVETGRAVGEPLRGHKHFVLSVAVSPDGRRVASASGDDTVWIWDFETHEVVRVLEGHSYSVQSVVFTPDGKRVVTGSWDHIIRAWDVESGETVLGPLHGHERDVNTVAVSSDGKHIASGSDDKTVRLWNAETGEAVGEPLGGHAHVVVSVAFSPDGRRVVSGSGDKTLMIWDVDGSSSTS